jgi:phage repressor protein C with HTH and peptisase S24 domain
MTWRNQRLRRFIVAEDSMRPTLEPGDAVVTRKSPRIRRGEIRFFEHPGRPDFWLVKRVGAITGGEFEAVSDNELADAIDSRSFGRVPIVGSYRLLVRVPRRLNR